MRSATGLLVWASLAAFSALLAGCGNDRDVPAETRSHATADDHAHDEGATQLTHYGDKTELFAEFPPLIVGHESAFAAHVTRLDSFKPLQRGRVTVVLGGDGRGSQRFAADAPSAPGIFRPLATPDSAGERALSIRVETPEFSVTHELGKVVVYADKDAAHAALHGGHQGDHGEAGIAFLKEQQWKVDFATAPAAKRRVRESVAATGTLRAPADGEAFLHAPSTGHLLAAGDGFPSVGMRVRKGQALARLVPHLGVGSDLATLDLDVSKARTLHTRAKQERERVESLYAQEAVAEKRLQAARGEEEVARAELAAAQARRSHYSSAPQGRSEREGLALVAPIDGVIAEVKASPGAFLAEGAPVLHIVDARRIWLEVRVAESDLGRLQGPDGAAFRIPGSERAWELDAGNSRLVAVGGVVDAASRTVPVVFEVTKPDPVLKVGMAVQAQVFAGRARDALAVPASAVLDESGIATVYVQTGGESFERRQIEAGVRDGDWIEVKSGVQAGERVVTRGAYLIKLAATRSEAVGHGHAH